MLADLKGHQYPKYELNRSSGCRVSKFDLRCDLNLEVKVTKIYMILADPKGHKYAKYELNRSNGC